MFEKNYLLKELRDFLNIYENKPIQNNHSGMRVEHCFALYCFLRELKPKHIIESGVWRGQTTWLIRKAIQNIDLYSIDTDLSQKTISFEDVNYLEKDITNYDWTKLENDKTLIIFDDHVCFSKRIDFLLKNKFKHIIFDDNLPNNFISYYTPKIIYEKDVLIKKKYIKYTNIKRFTYFIYDYFIKNKYDKRFSINFENKFVKIIYPPSDNHETVKKIKMLRDRIQTYYEFPPIIKFDIKKRFKKIIKEFNVDVEKLNFNVSEPITSKNEFQFNNKILDEMSLQYGNICYLNLK